MSKRVCRMDRIMDVDKFKVDFFVAGFPKCGTTSISQHLSEHPEICFSIYKEPCFFLPDAPDVKKQLVPDQKTYQQLFLSDSQTKIMGEGSVSYIYSEAALQAIFKHNPSAKLIVLVRNPISRTQSLHSHNVRLQRADIGDLEDEWNAQENGSSLARDGSYIFHHYRESGMQGKYLSRLYEIFPREQVLTIVFDDLKVAPEKVYREMLSFLGVSAGYIPHFKVYNRNRVYNSSWQTAVAKSLTSLVRTPQMIKVSVKIKRFLRVNPESCLVDRIFMRKGGRSPLSPDFHRQLVEVFRADVEHLGLLISRDLSDWLEVP